jgi:hypothetical protein
MAKQARRCAINKVWLRVFENVGKKEVKT